MPVTCKKERAACGPFQKIRNDLLLIAAFLLLLVLVGLCLLLTQKEGDTVRVHVNGTLYGVYALHEDTTVEIVTEAGYNRLVIRGGRAYMESADCPDGICVMHTPIDGTRESITCLPHGVVITVERVGEDEAPDVIV